MKTSTKTTFHRADKELFSLDTLALASALIGCRLVTEREGVRTSGLIVETEAYGGASDPAAHSYRGETPRTEVMFREAGHIYVYFIYGVHYCVNIVSEQRGIAGAVLIRALMPDENSEIMVTRRGVKATDALARGPGNVCKAMGIELSLNGEYAPESSKVWVEIPMPKPSYSILKSPRIGISKARELPWRFYVADCPYVSKGPMAPAHMTTQS